MPADGPESGLVHEISLVPETASDSAVRFLRAMIFSGELGPGDRLPPERDLGARLGISRMTLRLALKALESTGYIVTTRGSHGGSRVADTNSLVRCWTFWMREHAGELDDIFEFRQTVETRLAALAAERRTDDDLALIERAIARAGQPQEWPSLFRVDMDIHRSIARAARSPRLEQAMLAARGDLFIPVDLARLEAREHQVHDTHGAILAAIRAQDAGAAADQMRWHIVLIRELTDRALAAAGISHS
ncbi:MAG: FadR family transcriptional regulator [Thermoleophilia bacterium]|nr:FadR family transcriptional regulator [Thermoleophilia bacterium]